MTESQSTNPFLMGGGFETTAVSSANFNPFGGNASFTSNPFLQSFGGGDAPERVTEPTGTNPFAQFFATETTSGSIFSAPSSQLEEKPNVFEAFSTAAPNAAEKRGSMQSNVSDLLGDFADAPKPEMTSTGSTTHSMNTSPVDNFQPNFGQENRTRPERPSPPRRPPPPRPTPPKETKELILSVTGALEATSCDLLDRLQATRTPSPTPLRELNSPSPIMMGEVNDLLGDEIEMPKFTHGEGAHTKHDIQQEALNIFDAIANLSKDEENKELTPPTAPLSAPPPVPPLPPSRPPPPPLPVQCESDLSDLLADGTKVDVGRNTFPTEQQNQISRADSRETPQTSRKSSLISAASSSRKSSFDHTRREIESPASESMRTQVEEPAIKPPEIIEESVESPADKFILSDKKYVSYVASRKASHDVTASRIQIIPTHKKFSLDYSSGFFPDQDTIKEKFEQYATTDTDSSYSDNKILEAPKFPVISTTPIMSCENITNENLYENEKEPSLIFDEATEKTDPFASFVQNDNRPTPDPFVSFSHADDSSRDDPFAAFSQTTETMPKDDFDIFEEKFENVKQPTTADPFDPFNASGGANNFTGE